MRRFAGRFAALVLALLMLLSSMPLTALAEQQQEKIESVPFSFSAKDGEAQPQNSTGLPADRVQAIEDAMENGGYVSLSSAKVSANQVSSGSGFRYDITLIYNAACQYYDEENNTTAAAFSTYENVKLKITPPAGVELLDYDSKDGDAYIYNLRTKQPGTNETRPINARHTANGTTNNGEAIGKLAIEIEASVNDYTGTEKFTDSLGTTDTETANTTNTTISASADWTVAKNFMNVTPNPNGADTVTATWKIYVGKEGDTEGEPSDNNNLYNTTGVRNLTAFALTDTLPTITSSDDTISAAPSNITVKKGDVSVEYTQNGNKITINGVDHLDTTDLSKGDGTTIPTQAYTTFTVTADYDRKVFLEYVAAGNTLKKQEFTNTANITYQAGNLSGTDQASAPGQHGIATHGANITVEQYINIEDKEYPYSGIYATNFPGVEFALMKRDDTTGAYEEINVTITLGDDGTWTTSAYLDPGTYKVEQRKEPSGTTLSTITDTESTTEGGIIEITATEGEVPTYTVKFVNTMTKKGILQLKKVNEADEPIGGVVFTLYDAENKEVGTLTTGDDGLAQIAVPAGTYTLKETTAPEGYIPMEDIKNVTITTGEINSYYKDTAPIVNYGDTATLTINKEIAAYDGTEGVVLTPSKLAEVAGINEDFTFTIVDGSSTRHGTIAAGQDSATISGLSRVDNEGKAKQYKVTESLDMNSRFEAHTTEETATFVANVSTDSVDFVNILKSPLTISKTVQSVSGNASKAGYKFEIYEGDIDDRNIVGSYTTGEDGTVTVYLPTVE